jgi:branched-subunit amino acid transport protein AzlD
MTVWLAIAVVAVVNIALKAAGPVVLGERQLPDRAVRVVDALAAALLAGLLVTALLGTRWRDADASVAPGLLAAAGLALARVPALVCVAVAVVVTIGVRALPF